MPELKSFFETPQKARITIICLLVTVATLGAIIAYAVYALRGPGPDAGIPPAQSETPSGEPDGDEAPDETEAPTREPAGFVPSLTIDKARELALADAGVAEDEADISREALGQDNGLWVYEFRFRTQEAQYEYKLNANTGELRSKVKEAFVYASPGVTEPVMPSFPAESTPPVGTDPQPSDTAQPEQSSAPAASPSPAPSAVPSASPAPSQSLSMYIGMDRAKAIALEHAGLTAAQVRFTHTRMGREHGAMVYELEFRQGLTEYEYEIDAATGRILEHEKDAD